jgi:hypothetical protein
MKININIYKQLKENKMQCAQKIHNAIVQMKCNV